MHLYSNSKTRANLMLYQRKKCQCQWMAESLVHNPPHVNHIPGQSTSYKPKLPRRCLAVGLMIEDLQSPSWHQHNCNRLFRHPRYMRIATTCYLSHILENLATMNSIEDRNNSIIVLDKALNLQHFQPYPVEKC